MVKRCALAVVALIFAAGPAVAADDLSLAVSKIEAGISGILNGIGDAVSRAAHDAGESGPAGEGEIRKILGGSLGGKPYVIDAAFIDAKGILRFIEPAGYRQHEGTDISLQEVVGAVRSTQKPKMGNVFLSVEGTRSIDIEYPVVAADGRFAGAVSLLVNQEQLVQEVIAAAEKEFRVKCWVMQQDGLIMYETDPTQRGLNLFTDPLYREYPELLALGRRQVREREGSGTYTFPVHGTGTLVRKRAAWKTASLFGTDWIVVAYRETD